MKKSHIFIILAIIVTAFIFSSSLKTASDSSQTSGRLLGFINKLLSGTSITLTHNFIRKLAHFTEFFMQGLFLSLAAVFSIKGIKHHLSTIAFAGLLTACTDEFLQTFSNGRSAQITDVLLDFGGSVTAIILTLLLLAVIERSRKNV